MIFSCPEWKFVDGTIDGTVAEILSYLSGVDINEIGLFDYLEGDLGLSDSDLPVLCNEILTLISFPSEDNPFAIWVEYALKDAKEGRPVLKYHRVYDFVRKVYLGGAEGIYSEAFPKDYLSRR